MKRKATTQQVTKPKVRRTTRQQDKLRLAKSLMSNTDIKSHRLIVNAVTPGSSSPLFYSLTDSSILVPGTGMVNQYVGNRIQPVSLVVRYSCVMSDATNVVRLGIFQCEGTFTTTTSNYFTTTTNPLSAIENYPSHNFNTLSDNIMSGCVPGGHNAITTGKIFVPSRKLLPLVFNQSGAITSGHIGLVLLSDSAAASHPIVSFFSELRYKDI